MRRPGKEQRILWVAAALLLFASLPLLTARAHRGPAQVDLSQIKQIPIYLNDFELASVPPPRPPANRKPPTPNATAPPTKTGDAVYADTDPPSVQAHRVVDAFGTTLAESFQKSGFSAKRQTSDLPAEGVVLRGVFAEPDALNRVRRAILGAGAPGPNFVLYVGAFNLGRPKQPLYDLAVVQEASPLYGPVITLNAYIPLVKYEVPKDPTDQDVHNICDQIVAQLTALLAQNPSAVSQ
jgi:hypothetical protein